VTFLAPQGLSSESEASAAQVAALIKQIKADEVHTWFMENQLDPRLVKQIASATGAQPGGELYPEALSTGRRGGQLRENAASQRGADRGEYEINKPARDGPVIRRYGSASICFVQCESTGNTAHAQQDLYAFEQLECMLARSHAQSRSALR
jgi:hypothetical protein